MSDQNPSSTMSTPSRALTDQTQMANYDSTSSDLVAYPAILTLNMILAEEFSEIMRVYTAGIGSKLKNELEKDEEIQRQIQIEEDEQGDMDQKSEGSSQSGGGVASVRQLEMQDTERVE